VAWAPAGSSVVLVVDVVVGTLVELCEELPAHPVATAITATAHHTRACMAVP
jgi:hypothetical protein